MRPAFIAPERRDADGFVVRRFFRGDGVIVARAIRESYAHLRRWMEWAQPAVTAEQQEERVREAGARYAAGEDYALGIFSPDGTALWGGTGFHLREALPDAAEIGMWIHADQVGWGLGTRVLKEMLAWGFSDAWPWRRLSWRCDERNRASARVAEKAGLFYEGTLRGHSLAADGVIRDLMIFARLRADGDSTE